MLVDDDCQRTDSRTSGPNCQGSHTRRGGIRFKADFDWYGDPALHFKVILSDDASRSVRLLETSQRVREKVKEVSNFPIRSAFPTSIPLG